MPAGYFQKLVTVKAGHTLHSTRKETPTFTTQSPIWMIFRLGPKRGRCGHRNSPSNSSDRSEGLEEPRASSLSWGSLSVYLPSRHASPARLPEAPGWLCGRRCCRPGSSQLPGKGTCSQCPGSRRGKGVQMEAVCHLQSAGIHQEPAALRLWWLCPLRGKWKNWSIGSGCWGHRGPLVSFSCYLEDTLYTSSTSGSRHQFILTGFCKFNCFLICLTGNNAPVKS